MGRPSYLDSLRNAPRAIRNLRVPVRFRHELRTAQVTFLTCIALYAGLVGSAAYAMYKKDDDNRYTTFVERIFPYPAAVAAHTVIPLTRFRLEVNARLTYAGLHDIKTTRQQTEQTVIGQLIDHAVYAQALADNSIVISPADVDSKMQSIYTQLGSENALAQFLNQNYGPAIGVPQFRVWVEESLEQSAIQEQVLQHVHVRHILISIPSGATADQIEAARQKALSIKAMITSPDQFAAIAKQYSEDTTSRDAGGDIGVTVRGDDTPVYSADFQNAIFTMPENVVSDPILSPYGWHLVIVDDRAGSVQLSLKDYTAELESHGVKRFIGK